MNEGFNPPIPPDPHPVTLESTIFDKTKGVENTFPNPPVASGVSAPISEQISSVENKIKIAFKDYVEHAGEAGGDIRAEKLMILHKELAKLQEGIH